MFGAWADRGHARWCVIIGTTLSFPMMLLGPLNGMLEVESAYVTYGLLFTIVCTARLGQAIYHPAGAMIAGEINTRSRSGMVSLFVAFGWIGYGSSQAVFSFLRNSETVILRKFSDLQESSFLQAVCLTLSLSSNSPYLPQTPSKLAFG